MTFGDSTLHNLVASEEPIGSGLHLGPCMEGLGAGEVRGGGEEKRCFSFCCCLFVGFFFFFLTAER